MATHVLDAESHYLLSCAVELGELTPMEANLYIADTVLGREFMARGHDADFNPHELRNQARDFLANSSAVEQHVWALAAIPALKASLQYFAECLAHAAQVKAQRDLGITEDYSRLFSIEGCDETRWFTSEHDINPMVVQRYLSEKYSEAFAAFRADVAAIKAAIDWVNAGNKDLARKQLLKLGLYVPDDNFEMPVRGLAEVRGEYKENCRRISRAKGAIKRALRLFDRSGSTDMVRMMIAGEDVTLACPGSPFVFKVRAYKGAWLLNGTLSLTGHTPYQLSVHRADGSFLARLCVYFKETPVLDQLLALSMYINAGLEMELLQTANWFGIAPNQVEAVNQYLATTRPVLQEKLTQAQKGAGGDAGWLAEIVARQAPEQAHWQQYKQPVAQWVSGLLGVLHQDVSNLLRTPVSLQIS